jgi:hypothetical protein
MEYTFRAGDDGEPANRRWLLEQCWIKQESQRQEVSMILEEAGAELARLV